MNTHPRCASEDCRAQKIHSNLYVPNPPTDMNDTPTTIGTRKNYSNQELSTQPLCASRAVGIIAQKYEPHLFDGNVVDLREVLLHLPLGHLWLNLKRGLSRFLSTWACRYMERRKKRKSTRQQRCKCGPGLKREDERKVPAGR